MSFFENKIVELTNAKPTSDGFVALCPTHEDKTPSLSIKFVPGKAPLLKCFAGCEFSVLRKYFEANNAWPSKAKKLHKNELTNRGLYETSMLLSVGSIGERYLANRGLKPSSYKILKENQEVYHSDTRLNFPCLLSPITNAMKEFIGVHRTYLSSAGKKAEVEINKKIWGKVKGGSVKFGDEAKDVLHMAEGIETTLAIFQTIQQPAWAVLGCQNYQNQELPKHVKTVHIWADRDENEAGKKGADKALSKFKEKGVKTIIHLPEIEGETKCDWLDVLNKLGESEILEELKKADTPVMAEFIQLSEVKKENIEWIYEPFLPLSKLVLMEGDPGIGKSWIAFSLASAVSNGEGLFGGSKTMEPRPVLLICSEDGLGDTIKPRLDSLDANQLNIYSLTSFFLLNEEGKDKLDATLAQIKPLLVIIDPLVSVLGGKIDMNKSNEVRSVMQHLVYLAEKHKCTFLALRHLVKGDRAKAIYRGVGSIDFTAIARSIILVGRHPFEKGKGVMFHIKCNLAPLAEPLEYEIKDSQFNWLGKSNLTIDSIMDDPKKSNNEGNALEVAKDFLMGMLSSGPVSANDIFLEAKKNGISKKTVYRAKKQLSIDSYKQDMQWFWMLSKMDDDGQDAQDFERD